MSEPIDRIRAALSWSARAFGDYSDDIRALLDRLDTVEQENERLMKENTARKKAKQLLVRGSITKE